VSRLRQGENWWPDATFERQTIAVEQDARYEPDVWEEPIKRFLAGEKKITIMEIAIGALGYEIVRPGFRKDEERGTPINRIEPRVQHRIIAILTHLGWEPRRSKGERWWARRSAQV
jgi:hypothetical protein